MKLLGNNINSASKRTVKQRELKKKDDIRKKTFFCLVSFLGRLEGEGSTSGERIVQIYVDRLLHPDRC